MLDLLQARRRQPAANPSVKTEGKCAGVCPLGAQTTAALGHRVLAFACSDQSVLAVCLHCKRHSAGGRKSGLLSKYSHPVATAREVMTALGQGRHPKPKLSQKGLTGEAFDMTDDEEDEPEDRRSSTHCSCRSVPAAVGSSRCTL